MSNPDKSVHCSEAVMAIITVLVVFAAIAAVVLSVVEAY